MFSKIPKYGTDDADSVVFIYIKFTGIYRYSPVKMANIIPNSILHTFVRQVGHVKLFYFM